MLKGSSESVLWFPGKKPEGVIMTPMTGRASEIAKSREELLGLLHDLPESEYELSLTDLVQKEPQTDGAVPKDQIKTCLEADVRVVSLVKERKKRRSSASSRGSSSEGVLLNVYLPSSLTRSLTTPHSAHRSPIPKAPTVEFSKRDREPASLGCWSAIWDKGRGKWRRKGLERAV